jgi:hypothetical protein
MAGRGCTIVVEVLGASGGRTENQRIYLPVALHSPLQVLREQLHDVTSIRPEDQVLILCDLSDAERNSDVMLTGRDHLSLRQCGIENGSVLTLHALGMNAENKQVSTAVNQNNSKEKQSKTEEAAVHVLQTPITAAQANHRYCQPIHIIGKSMNF